MYCYHMIPQIIEKNPVKTVTNEKTEKEFWQDIQKYCMNPLETFDLKTNPGKKQWGLNLVLCSPIQSDPKESSICL